MATIYFFDAWKYIVELRNLITFIYVAELGSFTKAAEQLGYSQSTISFQIKQLEDELGCLLFERINHTITLTEQGLELMQKSEIFTDDVAKALLHDCGTIRRMLISSINTTKTNMSD